MSFSPKTCPNSNLYQRYRSHHRRPPPKPDHAGNATAAVFHRARRRGLVAVSDSRRSVGRARRRHNTDDRQLCAAVAETDRTQPGATPIHLVSPRHRLPVRQRPIGDWGGQEVRIGTAMTVVARTPRPCGPIRRMFTSSRRHVVAERPAQAACRRHS